MKKIFLTGASGYLGSNLLKALVNGGYSVTILLRISSKTNRITAFLDKINIVFIEELDINDHFANNCYDIVIHTAAGYGRDKNSFDEVLTPNLALPLKLLEASIVSNVKYFINTDTSLPRSINPYALAKKQFVEWLSFYSDKIVVLNIELEYFFGGEDDEWKFINNIIRKFLNKTGAIDFTTAVQQRDFIYIDDAVKAYLTVLQNIENFTAFNNIELGSGNAYILKDIITKLQSLCDGYATKLNFGAIPVRSNETMHSVASTTTLNALGWKPAYNLEQGLIKTIEKEKLNTYGTN